MRLRLLLRVYGHDQLGSPTKPLPMVRDPRMVFDQLFGVGATRNSERTGGKTDRSILDWMTREVCTVENDARPAPIAAGSMSISKTSAKSNAASCKIEAAQCERRGPPVADGADRRSGFLRRARETDVRSAGSGIRRRYHAGLIVQVEPRCFGRAFPESGVNAGFHGASHHGGNEQRITQFAPINKYHVSLMTLFSTS